MDDIENQIINIGSKNLVVFIDGLYNLQSDNKKDGIRVENIERAQGVKALVDVYQVPIICTGELRKKPAEGKKDKAPTTHDIMETGKFGYNANVVWLLSNSKLPLPTENELYLAMHYSKNKLSHFKGTQTLKFVKGKGIVEEFQSDKHSW